MSRSRAKLDVGTGDGRGIGAEGATAIFTGNDVHAGPTAVTVFLASHARTCMTGAEPALGGGRPAGSAAGPAGA